MKKPLLTSEEIERIVSVRIHPGIGVSRVGNSDDYYIGPEVMNPDPIPDAGAEDEEGNNLQHLYGYEMRDTAGAMKRQAARFRVYGYDDQGKVVAEILQSENTNINWEVHLANKKSAWYDFDAAMDIPENKDMSVGRRNSKVSLENRDTLVIDAGLTAINSDQPLEKEVKMSGHFKEIEVELGALKVDKVGRLLVLPGFGKSASPSGKTPYDKDLPLGFNNAEDWYDDIADGPVHATVTIANQTFEADPAWVISAPPNYAPNIIGWRTMNDLMKTIFINAGMMSLPESVSFTKDVQPILKRLSGLQWVNNGFAAQFGVNGLLNFEDSNLLKKLSHLPDPPPANPKDDPYTNLRQTVYNNFRSTENRTEERHAWPWIYGDKWEPYGPESIDNYLHLPALFTYILQKWVAGDFINDYDPTTNQFQQIDKIPLQEQPDMLDQAAMHFCLADAFHPGCELTWPIRHASMYRSPYRIREAAASSVEMDYGSKLTSAASLRFGGPLYNQWPGNLTRWMAIPWQGDTAFCRAGYEKDYSPYTPTYWPARVPNNVLTQENFDKVCDTTKSVEERTAAFNTRPSWLRHFPKYAVPAMNYMIDNFGTIGIVKATSVPDDKRTGEMSWLPAMIYVESMTKKRAQKVEGLLQQVQAKIAATDFQNSAAAQAGWQSEEHLEEFANVRRRKKT